MADFSSKLSEFEIINIIYKNIQKNVSLIAIENYITDFSSQIF